jgi:hypothetical protein
VQGETATASGQAATAMNDVLPAKAAIASTFWA